MQKGGHSVVYAQVRVCKCVYNLEPNRERRAGKGLRRCRSAGGQEEKKIGSGSPNSFR